MRKLILVAAVAVMACGAAFAQKGMQGIGINIGGRVTVSDEFQYRSGITDFTKFAVLSVEVKYHYNINNYYRIEPFASYSYYSDGPEYLVGINNDIFFCAPRRFRPYFIAGLGYSHLNYHYEKWEVSWYPTYERYLDEEGTKKRSCFYMKAGIGGDYRFSHKWSGQLELCATGHVAGDALWSLQLLAGVAYNF